MKIKEQLKYFFENPWVLSIPAQPFAAGILASIIYPSLQATGFETSTAASALGQIGFSIAKELLPSLTEAAKKGVTSLGDWLVKKMQEEPEVNQAAAETMVKQAEPVAEMLRETRPEDKSEVAEKVSQGLESYGGATAVIADDYAAAMKDMAELRQKMEKMHAKIDVWASQSVVARRESLIKDVVQDIEGQGKQEVIAEDNSSIEGVRQTIRNKDKDD